MRGIIATPGIQLGRQQVVSISNPDLQNLRFWLLFWDRIAVPEQRAVHVNSPETDFLTGAGICFQQPTVTISGELSEIIKSSKRQAFEALEEKQPGVWAWHATEGETASEQGNLGRSLRVGLSRALPIPDADVPLEDILFFRERRRGECEALMALIDDLYLSVRDSGDKPLAEHSALTKLTLGARDHLEAMMSSGLPFRLADIAADFNLPAAFAGGASVAALGQSLSAIVGNSLLAGASVTIGKVAGLVKTKKSNSPYRYLSRMSEELFPPGGP